MNIVEAGNTELPSLFCILKKGYSLSTECTGTDNYLLRASKTDHPTFEAFSYVSLLGLISMWEIRGDNWLTWSSEDKRNSKNRYGI